MACAAVIVASGKSRRMGFDKLAVRLDGIPVLRRTVDAFMNCPSISRVIVVAPQHRFESLLVGPFPKRLVRVDGGSERQDSVLNGLSALDETELNVAIHDGARPLVAVDLIERCIAEAHHFGAAALARPVSETLKRANIAGFTRESVDRANLWFMETPQTFRVSVLRRAYQIIGRRRLTITDEVSAVELLGIASRIVLSDRPNPKITRPADLALAEALLKLDAGELPDPS